LADDDDWLWIRLDIAAREFAFAINAQSCPSERFRFPLQRPPFRLSWLFGEQRASFDARLDA
jgi:hypothetical protein